MCTRVVSVCIYVSYFSGFILGFSGAILSGIRDMPVDSETPMVTSSIFRDLLVQFGSSEVLIGVECACVRS